jgi:hypothetical protein
MQNYAVTLKMAGSIRPKYGHFHWNTEARKYIWRNTITADMAKLAELINEACKFMRDRSNYYLELIVAPVDTGTVEEIPADQPPADKEVEELRTTNLSLKMANAELLEVINNLQKPGDPANGNPAPVLPPPSGPASSGKPSQQKALRANNLKNPGANCLSGRKPRGQTTPAAAAATS